MAERRIMVRGTGLEEGEKAALDIRQEDIILLSFEYQKSFLCKDTHTHRQNTGRGMAISPHSEESEYRTPNH